MTRQSWVALGLVMTLGATASWAADALAPSVAPGAAEAVGATLEVERMLLKEDLARHDRIAADRAKSTARLADLYASLDAALKRDDAGAPQALEDVMAGVEDAERERTQLLAQEREVVDRIRERLRRIDLLEERFSSLQAKATEAAGPLTGTWDIVLLPLNQRGTFVLTQNGTLVSGTYTLEGDWTGSLQGTLVNKKVYLQRIDSKLGRSAELEGFLSTDGTQIRGTWFSYEVSGASGSNGQWSAVRRPQAP